MEIKRVEEATHDTVWKATCVIGRLCLLLLYSNWLIIDDWLKLIALWQLRKNSSST